MLFRVGLIFSLRVETWMTFSIWMVLGLIVYFSYGFRKSKLAVAQREGTL